MDDINWAKPEKATSEKQPATMPRMPPPATRRPPMPITDKLLAAVMFSLLGLLVLCCGTGSHFFREAFDTSSPESQQAIREFRVESEARRLTEKAVLARMKAPGTTEFGQQRFGRAKDVVFVFGEYTSQNSFGAQLRGEYAAELSVSDDGETVTLVELAIE